MKNFSMLKFKLTICIAMSSILLISYLMLGCTSRTSSNDQTQGSDSDSCSMCSNKKFIVESVKYTGSSSLLIDRPAAISFFHYRKSIDKYERSDYQKLVHLLGMKNGSDRNIIYELTEQFSYYEQKIEPYLKRNSVLILDSLDESSVVDYIYNGVSYRINVDELKKKDGVLFIRPDRQPTFWTMTKEELYCKDYYSFVKIYFDCQ